MPPAKIRFLTPFRGVAALLVAVYHGLERLPALYTALWETTALFSRAYLCVDFFFILSGFVLMHVYGERFRRQVSPGDLRQFISARLARIYPLHLFFTALFLVLIALLSIGDGHLGRFAEEAYRPGALASNLLLVQALGIHSSLTWNQPSWSISAEWAAYLFFPVLCAWLSGRRRRLLQLAAAVSGIFLLANHAGHLNVDYDHGFLRCLLDFSLGMCVYDLFYRMRPRFAARSQLPMLVSLLASLSLMSVPRSALPDPWPVLSFGVLIWLTAVYQGRDHIRLDSRPLELLGTISYSIYLSHFFILTLLIKLSNLFGLRLFDAPRSPGLSLLVLGAFLVLVLGVSFWTYRLVEIPGRRYVKSVAARAGSQLAAS